jgi:integrase
MINTKMHRLVEEYLSLRRGLGFSLETPALCLRSLARYAQQIGHRGPLTVDLATRWALATRSTDPAQPARRLIHVRSFARHLVLLDPATEVPSVGLLGKVPRRKQPHIYSDKEIAALLQKAGQMLPHRGLRPRTYTAFFALLASTGLRLSEACSLNCQDVDLDRSLLTIRGSKFRKSRVVALHPTTTQALIQYVAVRDAVTFQGPTDAFFCTDAVPRLSPAAVKRTFARFRHQLGWTGQGRARRPRLHDMRHTFAVRRLLRWYQEDANIGQKLLALSTYLGHAKVTDTYWYLSAVPELMAIASQRFERPVHQQNREVAL